MFENFVIPALAFHLAVIAPSFQDLIPQTGDFRGTLNEFTIMDNVATKRPIVDIRRTANILQRRDASCDLIYKKLINASARSIATEELYAATQHCANGFYQDSLKDWRNGDPLFGNKILPWFESAVRTDLTSNAYFGDTERTEIPNAVWSTTKFDGIFKWLRYYTAKGIIPASQTFAMPAGDMSANPATAYAVFKSAVDRQPELMRDLPSSEKAFYVTGELNRGYKYYLQSLGDESSYIVQEYANGVKISSYDDIPIFVEPVWQSVMAELYGAHSNALILTIRGNFVFATDKQYGEGPNLDQALLVWYENRKLSWYFNMFMKAGTQIAIPQFIVYSVPS